RLESVARVVINPAEGLIAFPENTIGLGGPRFVWFNALKNSALNCNPTRSVKDVFLITERSTVSRPGPRNVPRPKLPQVLAVDIEKAAGSNHCDGFFKRTGPENNEFTSGRSGFLVFPSPDRFAPIWGVKGNPLNRVVMPFNCQPLISLPSPLAEALP